MAEDQYNNAHDHHDNNDKSSGLSTSRHQYLFFEVFFLQVLYVLDCLLHSRGQYFCDYLRIQEFCTHSKRPKEGSHRLKRDEEIIQSKIAQLVLTYILHTIIHVHTSTGSSNTLSTYWGVQFFIFQ